MQMYFCERGIVRSQQDGEIHFITAERVRELFDVPRAQSIVRPSDLIIGTSYVCLSPRSRGNYSEKPAPQKLVGRKYDHETQSYILKWESV